MALTNKKQDELGRMSKKKIKAYIINDVCENIEAINKKLMIQTRLGLKNVRVILEISKVSGIKINEMKDETIS